MDILYHFSNSTGKMYVRRGTTFLAKAKRNKIIKTKQSNLIDFQVTKINKMGVITIIIGYMLYRKIKYCNLKFLCDIIIRY